MINLVKKILWINAWMIPLISLAQEPIQIKKATSPIEFDGRPFEEAWNGLYVFPMTQSSPNFMSTPSEESDVRITYDDEYLWIGAQLFTKDPSSIIANSKKRDEMTPNSDIFGVMLDTYNDNENALVFSTMPTGQRTDISVSDDGARAPRPDNPLLSSYNSDWNTFWDVQTSRDEKGWYVEMRIPFTSLRFQPIGNMTTMGIIVYRLISQLNEMVTYPAVDPKNSGIPHQRPSLATEIQLEIAQSKRPVYISPYVIGGYSRNWELNADRTEYVENNKTPLNAGLDVKYSVTSNLTLDLTINPDFAQVEADNQQVNLTRYSLFFPEKRAFFQEGSNIFNFNLLGPSTLFHSRNIGIHNGVPVTILGGARLYGSAGKWDLGVLNMQTEKTSKTPGENFGVFRARRQILNPHSYMGGEFTSRISTDGRQNFAYGIDGLIRVIGDEYFVFKYAQTFDNKVSEQLKANNQQTNPVFFYSSWERRKLRGLAYKASVKYSGQHFTPGVGYVQRPGLYGAYSNVEYKWMPGPESKIFSHGPRVIYDLDKRLLDKKLETLNNSLFWDYRLKSGFNGEVGITRMKEGVLFPFPISSNVVIPADGYDYLYMGFGFRNSPAKRFNYNFGFVSGQFYDGYRNMVAFSPTWNASSSFQLSANYSFHTLRFMKRPTKDIVNIHQTSLNALYMFSTKLSARAFVQYLSSDNNIITNFRIRYNPREGDDLYIVFNDVRRVGNKTGVTPLSPPFYNNTIMVKYTHTFTLKL